jgi:hypothetical protein
MLESKAGWTAMVSEDVVSGLSQRVSFGCFVKNEVSTLDRVGLIFSLQI